MAHCQEGSAASNPECHWSAGTDTRPAGGSEATHAAAVLMETPRDTTSAHLPEPRLDRD